MRRHSTTLSVSAAALSVCNCCGVYCHRTYIVTGHIVTGDILSPGMYCHRAYTVTGDILSPGMYCHRACIVTGDILSPGIYCHRAYTVTGHVLSPDIYCHRACIVTEHILSPATVCVDVHGTLFFRRHIMSPVHIAAGNNIILCRCSRHILSAVVRATITTKYLEMTMTMAMLISR